MRNSDPFFTTNLGFGVVVSAGTFATGAITVGSAAGVGNGDTVVVGTKTATAGTNFSLGEDNDVMAQEIATYFTSVSTQVSAVFEPGGIVNLTANVRGAAGNLIALSANAGGGSISVSGPFLEGGS